MIDLEEVGKPGEHRLRLQAEGFAPEERDLAVTGPLSDLRLELSKGLRITGRVLDREGHPPGLFYVHVVEDGLPTTEPPRVSRWADVHPDGSFELRDLGSGRHNLLAGSDILGFAFAPRVRAGEDVVLSLRPAGWVELLVLEPDGAPAGGARVAVTAIGGHRVRGVIGRTNDQGEVKLYAPAGDLEIKAVKDGDLEGDLLVTVAEEGRTAATIGLRPRSDEYGRK